MYVFIGDNIVLINVCILNKEKLKKKIMIFIYFKLTMDIFNVTR